jgi:hypothetical protein
MVMENNKLILVYYINVLNVNDVQGYMDSVKDKIVIDNFNGYSIFIPVTTHESKIECINPKYITEKELIDKHLSMLKELNEELYYSIENLNKEKNE